MKPVCTECGVAEDGEVLVDQRPDGHDRHLLCSECYARALEEKTVLDELQADIWALRDSGLSLSEVADRLEIEDATLRGAWKQAKQNRKQAARSVELLRDVDELSVMG